MSSIDYGGIVKLVPENKIEKDDFGPNVPEVIYDESFEDNMNLNNNGYKKIIEKRKNLIVSYNYEYFYELKVKDESNNEIWLDARIYNSSKFKYLNEYREASNYIITEYNIKDGTKKVYVIKNTNKSTPIKIDYVDMNNEDEIVKDALIESLKEEKDVNKKKVIVRNNPFLYEYLDEESKNDKKLFLRASSYEDFDYNNIPKSLIDDPDIIEVLLDRDPCNFGYLSYDYRMKHKDQLKQILEDLYDPGLEFVSAYLANAIKDYEDNDELIEILLKKNDMAIMFSKENSKLRDDKELFKKLVSNDNFIGSSILEYASDNLKNDLELALLALNKNIFAYEYISDELKQKEEIKRYESKYIEAKNSREEL